MVRPFARRPPIPRWILGPALIASLAAPAAAQAPDAVAEGSPRRLLRAHWTATPPIVDGVLAEDEWQLAEAAIEFVQSEPVEGDPLSEETRVWVLYDRDNLYIGVHCVDSEPDRIVVNELRRDFNSREGDAFGISIDPFLDRSSAYVFFTNPGGALRDTQSFSDGRYVSLEWDGIWFSEARVVEDGWTAEVVIPFKTLGVRSASVDTMGINFKRRIRRKNEEGYWSFVPRRFTISYMSNEGELTGLGEVGTGGNLRVKPFVTGDTRYGDAPAADDAFASKGGVDLKYRLAEGLTLDATYNTDFSQVEADQQQVNLTRFSLFFPEKREFFLENAGIFTLGDVPHQRSPNRRSEETQLFYTRRIGLSRSGQPLSLLGGVRLSGQAGPWGLGLLNIHQRESDELASNNYTVARVRREAFSSQSDLGGMLVYRQGGEEGDHNLAFGGDFNARFADRLTVNAYAAGTRTPGVTEPSHAAQAAVAWEDTFYDAMLIATDIGEGFDPQVGFVPRTGVRNYHAVLGVTPRPRDWPLFRQLKPHLNLKVFTDRSGRLLTRDEHYALSIDFHDGGSFEASINPSFERLDEPFVLPNGVSIPAGDYSDHEWRVRYNSDRSRLLAGSVNLETGGYYDGTRTRLQASADLLIQPRFSASLNYEYNRASVEAGAFRADLYGARAVFSFSPRAYVDAYVQHNSFTKTTLTNVRFTWTYRPLSDLILVYNDTRGPSDPESWGAVIFKITRMFQF